MTDHQSTAQTDQSPVHLAERHHHRWHIRPIPPTARTDRCQPRQQCPEPHPRGYPNSRPLAAQPPERRAPAGFQPQALSCPGWRALCRPAKALCAPPSIPPIARGWCRVF